MATRIAKRKNESAGKVEGGLSALAVTLGEHAYRGAQLYHALYAEKQFNIAAMTNLSAVFRQKLAEQATIALPEIVRRYDSADGTIRYVLGFDARPEDAAARGTTIEAVFMPEESRQTICISTQAGCAVDCHFCLTATLGLIRSLSAGEILGQVMVALEDNHEALKPQTNVVLMGQGEPLLNYDAVMIALRILLDPEGIGNFAEACDTFYQWNHSGDRAAGERTRAAEIGGFAECIE